MNYKSIFFFEFSVVFFWRR